MKVHRIAVINPVCCAVICATVCLLTQDLLSWLVAGTPTSASTSSRVRNKSTPGG